MENKYWAILFIVFAVLFGVILFAYDQTLSKIAANSCSTEEANCPHAQEANAERIVIAAEFIVIVILLALLLWRNNKQEPSSAPLTKQAPIEEGAEEPTPKKSEARLFAPVDLSSLDSEEKRAYDIIKDKGGSVFQSDIIRETGFTKVKVSRILDKLENRGVLERKRRGMANIIVLK